jgi:hypothetical protein
MTALSIAFGFRSGTRRQKVMTNISRHGWTTSIIVVQSEGHIAPPYDFTAAQTHQVGAAHVAACTINDRPLYCQICTRGCHAQTLTAG